MKPLFKVAATLVLAGVAGHAAADIKPFEAVEYRKGIFKAVKWHFGAMGDMVKGKAEFDSEDFARRADLLAALSQMPWEGFRPGTYASATSALPVIEDEWEDFTAAGDAFSEKAAALAVAATGDDMKAIKSAFVATARTCKGCHDDFKD